MKHFFLFSMLAIGLILTACGNKAETTTAGEQPIMSADTLGGAPTMTNEVPTGATATGNPATGSPASGGSASGEAHYKCSKAGCKGTGDAQGKCPICGGDLAHNPAFHNAAPGATPQNAVTLDPTTGKPAGSATPPPTTITPPAEKNEKGVFHYTCSKAGCDGGGGAAGKCPKCGSDLAHNQAFHNK